jgi:hypothetical protein
LFFNFDKTLNNSKANAKNESADVVCRPIEAGRFSYKTATTTIMLIVFNQLH